MEKLKELFFRYKKHIYVVVGFFASLFLLFIIFDNLVMPYLVHNKSIVRVPNVIGKTLADAEREIYNGELQYKVTKEIYNEKYPQGYVIAQLPNGGMTVKSGRPIYLTLSKGKETIPVPYLIGTNIRNAKTQIMQRGLELGNITYDYSDIYGKDTVMIQSKAAGLYVPYGDRIDIVVSKGSINQARIPNLIGLSFDEISSVLSESGFTLGQVTYQRNETYLPNTVIDQSPKADETADAGTQINIVLAK